MKNENARYGRLLVFEGGNCRDHDGLLIDFEKKEIVGRLRPFLRVPLSVIKEALDLECPEGHWLKTALRFDGDVVCIHKQVGYSGTSSAISFWLVKEKES